MPFSAVLNILLWKHNLILFFTNELKKNQKKNRKMFIVTDLVSLTNVPIRWRGRANVGLGRGLKRHKGIQ